MSLFPPLTTSPTTLHITQNYTIVTVDRCSAKMKSCYVQTVDGLVKVDLTSTDFELLPDSPQGSPGVSDTSDHLGDSEKSVDPEDSGDSESLPCHTFLSQLMTTIETRGPDELLRPSEAVSRAAKQAVKEVIDTMENPSQGLHVDGFDAEQIWVQLDTLSRTAMRRVKRVLQRTANLDSVIPEDVEDALDELLGAEIDDGADAADAGHDIGRGKQGIWSASDPDDSVGLDDSEVDEDNNGLEYEAKKDSGDQRRAGGDSRGEARQNASWEDEYLNMDEMEAFLQDAEDEYAKEEGEDPEDEDLDNMLDDMMKGTGLSRRGKDADDDNVDLGSDPLANAKYDDFFAPVSSRVVDKSDKTLAAGNKMKRVHFIEAEDTDGESDEDDGSSDLIDHEEFADDHFEKDRHSGSDLDEVSDADEEGAIEDEDVKLASRHQLRLERMSDRIKRLEDEALGEREWYMRGEVSGSHRPMNSALEVDLDFETTMKPPPQPTEETTQSLEDLIKQRIADHHFDDVVPILLAKEEKKKTTVELDDVKSTQGLGQIYEEEYLTSQRQDVSEDKEQPIRELAKKQFIDLCAKLDQLSHGQFRPLPTIEEVTFKVDVPAIMMEEATPAFVSDASMRKPEEVFRPGQSLQKSIVEVDEEGEEKVVTKREGMMQAGGVTKSEAELTREDRKRRRAAKKRASKKRRLATDAERIQKSMATGKAVISGRKSEESAQMLRKLASSAKKSSDKSFKSREVFARLQHARSSELRGGADINTKQEVGARKAMHLKL